MRILPEREDAWWIAALLPPLACRLIAEGAEAASQRLMLLVLAAALAHGWAFLFARTAGRPMGAGLIPFAILVALLPPGPVGWGMAALAVSFGCVFGREVFGGRPPLPPAAVAMAFALFSFPGAGFEARDILSAAPDPWFALSCLPGAAILAWRGRLSWQVAAAALAGAVLAGVAMGAAAWWEQPLLGGFAPAILFLAAGPEAAPRAFPARLAYGMLAGGLVVLIRMADPNQPDGAIFAVLLAALFAPLLDRALGWRPRHE